MPKMDNFSAAMIADGEWDLTEFEPSEETEIEAYQHLIDTGLANTLQGHVARVCQQMIDEGHCHPRGWREVET